jgi:ABC-type amino acid transport substrate-binding protein
MKRIGLLASACAALLAAVVLVVLVAPVQAQELTGTLAKARATGAITIGYRESSVPFSYLNARKEPIGYSIELCRSLVSSIEDAVNKSLTIKWVPVTSDSRIDAVVSGKVDLECGSTTSNLERQKRVSFSPTMFVSGTKVLVKKGSPIKSFRDLTGRKVAVTAGTTNEKTLRELSEKFKLGINLLVTPDHAESFGLVKSGQADAFATDDVLLYGLIAQDAAKAKLRGGRRLSLLRPLRHHVPQGRRAAQQGGRRLLPGAGGRRRDRAAVQALVPAQAAHRREHRPADERAAGNDHPDDVGEGRVGPKPYRAGHSQRGISLMSRFAMRVSPNCFSSTTGCRPSPSSSAAMSRAACDTTITCDCRAA